MEINLLMLKNIPIWEQLLIEEALLRTNDENWCLLNHGSLPAIIMGISGKPEHYINYSQIDQYRIPVWRRFSGGGTVCIDENTLFSTFIFNSKDIKVQGSPDLIYLWSKKFYDPIFKDPHFQLKERDYVFENKKFGGNAQYIRSNRWLHHSSFLWDFNTELMNCLLLPPKMPNYRKERSHFDFLCKLKDFLQGKENFFERCIDELKSNFSVKIESLENVRPFLSGDYRKATTKLISFDS